MIAKKQYILFSQVFCTSLLTVSVFLVLHHLTRSVLFSTWAILKRLSKIFVIFLFEERVFVTISSVVIPCSKKSITSVSSTVKMGSAISSAVDLPDNANIFSFVVLFSEDFSHQSTRLVLLFTLAFLHMALSRLSILLTLHCISFAISLVVMPRATRFIMSISSGLNTDGELNGRNAVVDLEGRRSSPIICLTLSFISNRSPWREFNDTCLLLETENSPSGEPSSCTRDLISFNSRFKFS
mmetsp:Transcript_25230/g.52751  ORF Transcript_25230/g.52751 Transcript_25230/m.52751 type:complete len:240 (+) Transcript_25230:3314-4033(+)